MADANEKPKRPTVDDPDFTPEDIKLIDAIWDRIGKGETDRGDSGRRAVRKPKPKNDE